MAFECHRTLRIGLNEIPIDCLDNPRPEEEIDRHQVLLINNIKNFTFESENQKPTSKITAKTALSVNESSPNHSLSITDLPPALISEILNCLDPKELGIVSCVNTYLYRLASEHHVWKEFYCERWGHPVKPAILGPGYLDEKSWKELFVEREFHSKSFMGRFSIDTLRGHTEAIRAVFVLVSKKVVFTSGYDQIVRMWDMEDGLSIASSRALGCTIRALAADTRLLVAGGTDGFIHGWKAEDGNPHSFDICGPQNQNMEFRLWEHVGPITCLSLDFGKIYSGSWDMTIRIWDRSTLKCLNVLAHNDWVWSLVPHDTLLLSTAGPDVHLWDISRVTTFTPLVIINNAHIGNTYSLACSHTGKLLFTGGEDGSIHMYEINRTSAKCNARKVATWIPHTGPVNSLAFEFPWLVSASSDGKISLIDVRNLLKKTSKNSSSNHVEPPQRMLHGFGCNLFSVAIGFDRIVCGGEEGVVRIWNFSQALEIEQRVRMMRGFRLENRMRRRKLQAEISSKGSRSEQCSVAAKRNQRNGDRSGWHTKQKVSGNIKGQR